MILLFVVIASHYIAFSSFFSIIFFGYCVCIFFDFSFRFILILTKSIVTVVEWQPLLIASYFKYSTVNYVRVFIFAVWIVRNSNNEQNIEQGKIESSERHTFILFFMQSFHLFLPFKRIGFCVILEFVCALTKGRI